MKETHKATVAEEKEPSKKVKQDEARFLLLSQGNNILQSSCTYHVYIFYAHIMHIYFLEYKMFKWNNTYGRITRQGLLSRWLKFKKYTWKDEVCW